MDDREQLRKRFSELASRAERTGIPQETKFLNMAEQSELLSLGLDAALFGGYDGAERRIAVFGADEGFKPGIAVLRIAPASRKFADDLTHRDFLGSLTALGINREVLGDIVIKDGEGYLICLESIAPFVIENLKEVKRTSVNCAYSSVPDEIVSGGEEKSLVVASERLDALIAAVYDLPREEAKALSEKGLVFVNARLAQKGGAVIPEGSVVSVRGKGRFVYLGLERETKKGKMRVRVKVY